MKAEDKHRWKLVSMQFGKTYRCLDCDCKKVVTRRYISYSRSGIVFNNSRPNCIKKEIEDQKGID